MRLRLTPDGVRVKAPFWKIHAADDKIFWSASSDGTTWNEVHSVDAGLELSDMELHLVGGNAKDVLTYPVIRFDLLNLDPMQ